MFVSPQMSQYTPWIDTPPSASASVTYLTGDKLSYRVPLPVPLFGICRLIFVVVGVVTGLLWRFAALVVETSVLGGGAASIL